MKLKRIFCLFAALFAILSVNAAAESIGDIRVSFKIGEDVIDINGVKSEIPAPYIVGGGTTLVPVRVITEAFGADVEWDEKSQVVTLFYQRMRLSLQIDNDVAMINNTVNYLSVAPELYNGTTMVPLRFISENFGATVSYDNGLITVLKKGIGNFEYIGDSYYGWTMKNPTMADSFSRNGDGSRIVFGIDGKASELLVACGDGDELDAEGEIEHIKNVVEDGRELICEIEDAPVPTLHYRMQNDNMMLDERKYVKDGKCYGVTVVIFAGENVGDELFSAAESFSVTDSRAFYDFSDVEDGVRKYKNKFFDYALDIPAEWISYEDENGIVNFVDPKSRNHILYASVFSSDSSPEILADKVFAEDSKLYNSELVKFDAVEKFNLKEFPDAYGYWSYYNGESLGNYVDCNVFIKICDYVYNIRASANTKEEVQKIIGSFSPVPPSYMQYGNIELPEYDLSVYSAELDGINVSYPQGWYAMTSDSIKYAENEAYISISIQDNVVNDTMLKKLLSDAIDEYRDEYEDDKPAIVTQVKTINSGNRRFYAQTLRNRENVGMVYSTFYITRVNGKAYIFLYQRIDICRGAGIDAQAESIITSFKEK